MFLLHFLTSLKLFSVYAKQVQVFDSKYLLLTKLQRCQLLANLVQSPQNYVDGIYHKRMCDRLLPLKAVCLDIL